MNRSGATIAFVIAVSLITATTSLAKEVSKVTISGPGLKTPIEITDGASMLTDTDNIYDYRLGSANPPAWISSDTPYFELAVEFSEAGKVFATDRIRYYPAPEGKSSVFNNVGTDEAFAVKDGKAWFPATPSGEKWLRAILAKNGVDVAALVAAAPNAEAQPVQAAAPSAPVFPWALIGGGLALIAALGVGAWLVRSRMALQRS